GVSRVVVPTSELRSVLKTRDNVIVGTPQYMAPEQARGVANIDERADLWSAGVVLFELFTGELPFDGDAIGDVLVDIATADVPPLSRLRPELEGPLTELVARAMTRDLDARFESAAAMREALVEIRAQLTPELLASAPEHTRQRSLPLIGGVDVPSSPRAPIRCDPSGRARDETLTLAAPEADAPPRSRAALLGVAVGAALALAAVAFGVALATGAGARDGEDDHAAPAPDVHESASLPAPSTEPPIEETQPSLPPSAEEPEEPRGETVEPSAPRASRRAGRAERRRARPLRDPGY
ncbi:MAG: serine/threonine-protein kinase, partial [Sandaracinaceae bacterium]